MLPVDTKVCAGTDVGTGAGPEQAKSQDQARDIRSARPYVLTRGRALSTLVRLGATLVQVALDLAGLTLGVYAALGLRELLRGHAPVLWGSVWATEADWLPFLALVTVLVFSRAGLYGPRERRAGFGSILASLTVVGVLTVAFSFGAGHRFATYGVIPTAIVLASIAIGLLRVGYDVAGRFIRRLAHVRRRAVLLGDPGPIAHLDRALSEGPGIEYEIAAMMTDKEGLRQILHREAVDELIVDGSFAEHDLLDIAAEAHRQGVKVVIAPRAADMLARRGRYVPGQAVPLYELHPPAFASADWALKRLFDYVLSIGILVLTAPLWVLIALLVKVSSRGPVIYAAQRVGLEEREFPMFKFRTMYVDADELQDEIEAANELGGSLIKLRHDDYRRLEPHHLKRCLVLPGMTGLWQISGRGDLGFDDLVRLDFHYLETWSIWLDIWILLRTIPAVLAQRGAY